MFCLKSFTNNFLPIIFTNYGLLIMVRFNEKAPIANNLLVFPPQLYYFTPTFKIRFSMEIAANLPWGAKTTKTPKTKTI